MLGRMSSAVHIGGIAAIDSPSTESEGVVGAIPSMVAISQQAEPYVA
jgi:hypothetical protein